MVQLSSPGYLWLLPLVPFVVWRWLRQRRGALRHPTADRLPPLGFRAKLVRRGGAVLRGLGLLLIVIALAGPRLPDLHTRIDTEGIAVMLVVDVSGSMAEPDFDWNGQSISRLGAVKKVFDLFVTGNGETPDGRPIPGGPAFQGRATDLVGLVVFAARPEVLCPPTLSHSTLVRMLKSEEARRVPGDSETNLSDAIVAGLYRLQKAPPKRKVLVLLTDGEHNVTEPRSGWTPRQATNIARSLGVPLYTIDAGGGTAGSREGPPSSPGMTREQAVRSLQELAEMTGGKYFAARDTAALVKACQTIDALERSDITSFQYRRYREAYPFLCLASLAAFALALGLDLTLWRRVP